MSPSTASFAYPSVTVASRAATRLRAGHPWVYRSDVTRTDPLLPGEPVVVLAESRKGTVPLGVGFHSSESIMTVRLASRRVEMLDGPWLRRQLRAAQALRERAFSQLPDAYRWVHAEADGLPGIVVDRMGDALSVQLLTQASDQREADIIDALAEIAKPRAIALRNDVAVRQKEGLALVKRMARGEGTPASFREGDVKMTVDLLGGQKTGTFLDQRDNHVLAGLLARGRALDCFSGDGGFALQMAGRAASVIAVDASEAAAERIAHNAEANGLANVRAIAANAFDLLREQSAAGERYDTIVLDPPAFAKSRQHLDAAYRGYKELNLRALKMLEPGGLLVTCSCSQAVTPLQFEEMLHDAAADAQREVQLLFRRGAGPDHPVKLGFPESEYLKCAVLRVTG